MKNYLKKWLGIDALQSILEFDAKTLFAHEKRLAIIESALGAKVLDFHRSAVNRAKSQRYDEIERARKLDRKRKHRSKGQ